VEGGGCGHSGDGMSGRGLSSADGEGSQPLGAGSCGIEKVRCGTMDDELSDGTEAPRRKDSLNDGSCESRGWNCRSKDASCDTRVER
jgi:hypothetical protein